MSTRMPVTDAVSAGGVAWRRNPAGSLEIVICGRTRDAVWGLPKGMPEPGEALVDTALREVSEETGLQVALGPALQPIDYWFVADGARVHKRVHFWLMQAIGGDVANHDVEFDDVRWVAIDEAVAQLTYKDERDVVLEAARRLLETEPWTATTVSG